MNESSLDPSGRETNGAAAAVSASSASAALAAAALASDTPAAKVLAGYERFWPYFIDRHQHLWTRRLHAVATVIAMGCMGVAFPLTLNAGWLVMGPLVAYPIAWVSHFTFERRKPAAWVNPYWSFLCDVDMTMMMIVPGLSAAGDWLDPRQPFDGRRRALHRLTERTLQAFAGGTALLALLGHLSLENPFSGG